MFAGCMLLDPSIGFAVKPFVPPRVPPFPIVKVFDDSEFPAIELSELPAIAFAVSPLGAVNPLLPPKVFAGTLLLEPNVAPAGRLKVLVVALLLSAAPKGDLNKAGGSDFGVGLLPNVNWNLGFSGAAGSVDGAGGAGLLGALLPKLLLPKNTGTGAALLVWSLFGNSGAGLSSGHIGTVGVLVVSGADCDGGVNKVVDTPNEKVGFGLSADDEPAKSTELRGVSFFVSAAR